MKPVIRLRTADGYIDFKSMSVEWLQVNRSFTIYRELIPVGQISIVDGKVLVTVLEGRFKDIVDDVELTVLYRL